MDRAMKIRPARAEDAPRLPDIEQSAGELFRTVEALAWIADSENVTAPRYDELIRGGASFVAEAENGRLIGFVCAEILEGDLHIHELAVVLDFQRRGIGRLLVEESAAWASERGLSALTLTTFRSLAWNERFYKKIGFGTLLQSNLEPYLASIMSREAERGLPLHLRCAMRRPLG